ncbi:MAG TPA: hypothetical protein VK066_24900 [Chloroflexota bacterium]|nr:hypothetical protein [Chloroflexota bacterium]
MRWARGGFGGALAGIGLILALAAQGIGVFPGSAAWGAPAGAVDELSGAALRRVAAQGTSLNAFAWGTNFSGQLGNGTTAGVGSCPSCNPSPGQVPGLSNLTALEGGNGHTLALRSDGTVWAWGNNGSGQLGNGTTSTGGCACIPTPGQVVDLSGAVGIAAGFDHSLAVKGDGTAWAWGGDTYGQLGNGGTSTGSSVPGQVMGLSGVTAVAAGTQFSAALTSSGTVWAWGINDRHELGTGSTLSYSTVPVQANSLTGVRAIAAGSKYILALRTDGTVWGWGANDSGQLGNGSTTDSSTPVQVSGLSSIVGIAAGYFHALALKSDGTVWAWGANQSGQLGNGTSGDIRTTPVPVSALPGVVAVAAGDAFSLALRGDGTVWSWGRNEFGELGTGTSGGESDIRVQVSGLNGATAVAAGEGHGLALCCFVASTPTPVPTATNTPVLPPTPTTNPGATATPTVVGAPTATPTPTAVCSPRPAVRVTVQPAGANQLSVTVAAGGNARLQQLQFGAATNALIDVAGTPEFSGNRTITLPLETQLTTFTVHHATVGQATTVPLTVVDGCGSWPTFVGGGPNAF